MSIEIVKTQIYEFLASDKPEVLAIKGAWGVGKTYSWNKFLCNAKNDNAIALERYSYVSLFGINSLDSFKYTIFEHVISRDIIGAEANIDTFRSNTTGLLEMLGRKSVGWFRGASILKDFTPAIESLSFLSLNKSLICVDDLERRGANLSMKDALGLVSQLKEQKACKVVLLLNDKEDGLEDYKKYREKVIDVELKFEPTSSESADIAFNESPDEIKPLAEFSQRLDIKNIRVLKKIERLVKLALPLTEGYEPEIKHQVFHSLVLFSWCYYCTVDGAPPLKFVTNMGYDVWGLGEKKEDDEEKTNWKNSVSNYEYLHTDELDLVLAEAVRTGYIIEGKFREEATKKNDQLLASKSEGSFSETWRLYHDSFENNEEEVISKLYESFMKNVNNITPTNLNGTVRLFRELGEDGKASEIISYYLDSRKSEKELFNMENNNFFGDIRDPEIIDKFNSAYQESIIVENAIDVLKRIAGKNGWNQKDEIVLSNTTEDEYYDLFKSEVGDHLSSYVHACLQFGKFGNASDQQKEISKRSTAALKRIASESELNKRRVKKYGIEIDA